MVTVAAFAVAPPFLPTMPMMVAPISCASTIALTRLALMFLSRLPPPTENTSRAVAVVEFANFQPIGEG